MESRRGRRVSRGLLETLPVVTAASVIQVEVDPFLDMRYHANISGFQARSFECGPFPANGVFTRSENYLVSYLKRTHRRVIGHDA